MIQISSVMALDPSPAIGRSSLALRGPVSSVENTGPAPLERLHASGQLSEVEYDAGRLYAALAREPTRYRETLLACAESLLRCEIDLLGLVELVCVAERTPLTLTGVARLKVALRCLALVLDRAAQDLEFG